MRADRPAGKMERVFLRFMLGSLAALVVVVGGGFLALRQIAIDEAEHDTRERVEAAGRVVEAAGLSDGVLTGDRAALRRLDDLVLGQVLTGSVVRVKLWTEDGQSALLRRAAADRQQIRRSATRSRSCSRRAARRPS